jgi:hypothetical protein
MRQRGRARFALFGAALLAVLVFASTALASKGVVSVFGSLGGTGGQFSNASGLAVNQSGTGGASAGDLYVVDTNNNRLQQLSSAGAPISASGYDVAASGPGNTGANEQQTVTVKATKGVFSLSMTVANVTGVLTSGSNEVTEAKVSLGSLHVGDAIVGGGIPGGTTITAVGSGTLTLSANATLSNTVALTVTENTGATGNGNLTEGSTEVTGLITKTGSFAVGKTVTGTGIPANTTILAVGPGTLTLSAAATSTVSQASLTATNIPYNASAAELQSALEALPGIGAAGVTVTGGPGDATGSTPYTVTFSGGLLAGNDVAQMTSSAAGLTEGTKTVTVATKTVGGGAEVCKAATDVCKAATASAIAGGLSAPQGVAVDQASGLVYVTDQTNRRIDVFSATGAFQGAFGWKVKVTGAAEELQLCTVATGCQAGTSGGKAGQLAASVGYPAIDPTTGNVVVADSANRRVDVYTPTITAGEITAIAFQRAYGWNVVSSGPDDTGSEFEICNVVANPTDVCQAGSSGSSPGQFSGTSPTRVAVGNAGSVYAVDNGNNRVQKFDSSGNPIAVFASGQLSGEPSPTDVAVNPTNNRVLVVKPCNATICPGVTVAAERHVLEFDSVGTLLDTHAVGAGVENVRGMAFGSASGNIYLSSTTGGQRVFILNTLVPPTVTMKPVSTFTGTTATFEGEVNPQGLPTTYHFEYSPNGVEWTKAPATDANLGFSDSSSHPVSLAVTGLSGSQLYHVRLVATKSFGGGSATSSEVTFTTPASAPGISGEQVTERQDTTAALQGAVNPENQETTYHFEYVDNEEFEAKGYANASKAPLSDASIGSGNAPVTVSQAISGLLPDTKYHFRVVATNATDTTEGTDHTFMTFPGQEVSQGCPNEAVRRAQHTTYLPDCRGIELVNQPDKGNQNIFSRFEGVDGDVEPTMSPDGDSVIWNVNGSAPGATAPSKNAFIAERETEGWQSHGLTPPAEEQLGEGNYSYRIEKATPDLRHFLFSAGPSSFGSPPVSIIRLDRERHQDILRLYPNVDLFHGPWPEAHFGEFTDDGEHALIINPETRQLEDLGGETPELISVMPGGGPSQCGLSANIGSTGQSFAGKSPSGNAAGANWRAGYRMMDVNDASRVYFEVAANGNCGGPFGLYERKRKSEETVLIDPGTGSGITTSSEFIRSTPDGRHAYFTTLSKLDAADTNSTKDIYRWDEEAGQSTCLTCVVPNAAVLIEPSNSALVMISNDFSHIYFKSEQQLVPGKGAVGQKNTYVLSEGTIRYVGGKAVAFREDAALSDDGNTMLFRSSSLGGAQELTSEQLATKCDEPPSFQGIPQLCREFFIYHDQTGSFECVSCRPGGVTTWMAGSPFTSEHSDFKLSADGSTAAFITLEELVPRDVNDAADVYEWREGKIRLITDGVSAFPEGFAASQVHGVSDDGSVILFAAEAPGLTGFEQDGEPNLYEARINGGFEPPDLPAHCSEESCQGPLQAAPAQATAASAGFSGRGDAEGAKPRHCRKGKVRRHGRCVSRHTHKRRHARASHVEQGRTK